MKITCRLIVLLLLMGCQVQTTKGKVMVPVDLSTNQKVNFESSDHLQTMEVTWMNDSAMIAKIRTWVTDSNSQFSAGLINQFPNANGEIFVDENNNSFSVCSYSAEDKTQNIYARVDITLDTNFAIIKNWQPKSDNQIIFLNKIMKRVKEE